MDKARAAWLTSLGLLGAGWITAHVLSYVLFVPHAERGEMLSRTGHGYFRPNDLIVLCVLVALAGTVALFFAPSTQCGTSPYLLGLIPPVGFVIQEHVERIVSGGVFPTHLVAEPRFLVGFLLQLPFALAALLFARALVRFTHALRHGHGGMRRPKLATVQLFLAPTLEPRPVLPSPLAFGRSERAPPLAAAQ